MNKGDVNRDGGIEQVLLAVASNQLDYVLVRLGVELAAFQARVDEGMQPDAAHPAGTAGSGGVKQLHHNPSGQAVGLERILGGQLRHRRRH